MKKDCPYGSLSGPSCTTPFPLYLLGFVQVPAVPRDGGKSYGIGWQKWEHP